MIEKLKVFEVAWKEFVEWMKGSGYDYIIDIENFAWDYKGDAIVVGHPELYGLAIEWLDSKGICFTWSIVTNEYTKITYYAYRLHTSHFKDYTELKLYYGQDVTPVRSEATEAGIIKAFEILNGGEK